MTAAAKKHVPKCHGSGKPFERRIAPARVEKMKYDGARHEVLVEGMPQWQCDGCKITVTDDDSDTVVQNCLRRHIGLLTAEEIREARMALGFTQSQLADLLGCAAESLSRWENGAILQSRSYDRLLRVFFHLPAARQLLDGLTTDSPVGRKAVTIAGDAPAGVVDAMRALERIWKGSSRRLAEPSGAAAGDRAASPQARAMRESAVGRAWLATRSRSDREGSGWQRAAGPLHTDSSRASAAEGC